jgi:hypothetical protein
MKSFIFLSLLVLVTAQFTGNAQSKELEREASNYVNKLITGFETSFDKYEDDFNKIHTQLMNLRDQVEFSTQITAMKWYLKTYPLYDEFMTDFNSLFDTYAPAYSKNFQEIYNKALQVFITSMKNYECNIVKQFVVDYNNTHSNSDIMDYFYVWQNNNLIFC